MDVHEFNYTIDVRSIPFSTNTIKFLRGGIGIVVKLWVSIPCLAHLQFFFYAGYLYRVGPSKRWRVLSTNFLADQYVLPRGSCPISFY
jgi:hypothetical protein